MPVGSIYLSLTTDNPTNLFGGTWERIKDTFLLAAGDTYALGGTGGAATVTLSTANMPAHTHTRGTMDITGSWRIIGDGNNAGVDATGSGSGAISNVQGTGSGSNPDGTTWNCALGFDFKASNNWTGETSSVGNGEAISNMPPYLAVYIWKRIS